MTGFTEIPHLPRGKAAAIAVGEDYAPRLAPALKSLGIEVLVCPRNPLLDRRLASHIDLSLIHLGKNRFIISKNLAKSDFARALSDMGAELHYSESEPGPDYPEDASLCALMVRNVLFHNFKYSDSSLKKLSEYRHVQVGQGYAKCAVCLVDENAAITADAGMASAMRKEGLDVLEISAGGISLPGFGCGFIGGSALKISPDLLAFTGNILQHPDCHAILRFLSERGIEPVFLTDSPIFDSGSIILLSDLPY